TLPNGPSLNQVDIDNFVYQQGDLSLPGSAGRPPVVPAGPSLTFFNDDAKKNIFPPITGCRSPCTGATGIAFPLAGGPTIFQLCHLGFWASPFSTGLENQQALTAP